MISFKKFKTLPQKSKRRIVVKYVLFQVPGLVIISLILSVIEHWINLPLWLSGGIIGLWIIKDVFMFYFVWSAYTISQSADAKSLIGKEGIAEERLNPSGYIRVHGELWRAEVMGMGKNTPIEKGETVLIEGIYGLTLLVQPVQER